MRKLQQDSYFKNVFQKGMINRLSHEIATGSLLPQDISNTDGQTGSIQAYLHIDDRPMAYSELFRDQVNFVSFL